MNIGVINESLKIENRAGLSPSGVSFLVEKGHKVFIQAGAGLKAGYSNEDFVSLGAQIVFTKEEVFGRSDVVLNISPLNQEECALVKENQILLGFHHLAVAKKNIVEELIKKNVTMIGYEIVEDEEEDLPFISSLSEIAGQMCHAISGHYLQSCYGGRGLIMGGVVSVPPATAVIVGSTILARSAIKAMIGAGAHTIALGRYMDKLKELEEMTSGRLVTLMASNYNLQRMCEIADILIGAVLRPGKRAPMMITREMVKKMKKGSIIIDLSIDQGGCIETSHPTSLEHPTFMEEGVIHYCVPNITSAVSRTSTKLLSNLVIPYLLQIGEFGIDEALKRNQALCCGVYMYKKSLVKKNIAERFNLPYKKLSFEQESGKNLS
ncbi:MAG TPA: alanine dehydrogenase [Candidatus Aminicenantes bacterium]|nr:alanine dehydrogenase [Candidatus Aminicenantes bacterium]